VELNIKSALGAYSGKAELIPITRELLLKQNLHTVSIRNLKEEKRTAGKKKWCYLKM
jgi:hypothetical protein